MPFNTDLLCHTTGYQNNCGLNCFANFLIRKLETGELQRRFASHPAYARLLEIFRDYYQLDQKPTWEQINQLFTQKYTDPVQQEMIFGPVLRTFLGEVLAKPEVQERMWETYMVDPITDYLENGNIQDVGDDLARSNKKWLEELKEEYDAQVAYYETLTISVEEQAQAQAKLVKNWNSKTSSGNPLKDDIREYFTTGKIAKERIGFFKTYAGWIAGLKTIYDRQISTAADQSEKDQVTRNFFQNDPPIIDQTIIEMVSFERRSRIVNEVILPSAKAQWLAGKGKLYAQLMGDPSRAQFTGANQLGIFAHELGMHIEAYGADTDRPRFQEDASKVDPSMLLKLYNPSGGHWEYEEPTGDEILALQHNLAYMNRKTQAISAQQIRDAFKSLQPQQGAGAALAPQPAPGIAPVVPGQAGPIVVAPLPAPLPPVNVQPPGRQICLRPDVPPRAPVPAPVEQPKPAPEPVKPVVRQAPMPPAYEIPARAKELLIRARNQQPAIQKPAVRPEVPQRAIVPVNPRGVQQRPVAPAAPQRAIVPVKPAVVPQRPVAPVVPQRNQAQHDALALVERARAMKLEAQKKVQQQRQLQGVKLRGW